MKVYPRKVDLTKLQLGKLKKYQKEVSMVEDFRYSLIKKIKKMKKKNKNIFSVTWIENNKYNQALEDVLKVVEEEK